MSASVDELRATVENLSLSPAPTVSFIFAKRLESLNVVLDSINKIKNGVFF